MISNPAFDTAAYDRAIALGR